MFSFKDTSETTFYMIGKYDYLTLLPGSKNFF